MAKFPNLFKDYQVKQLTYSKPEGKTQIRSAAFHSICIGVARGGHGRAFALPSLNFALPSKPSFYLKYYI